ncbi:MAG: hypothetical protein AB7R89_11145 [Dehalococcoidia bacterium]
MWLAAKSYARAVAILEGDGDARTRVWRAATEIVGLMAKTMPADLWERQQEFDARVTCVRSPEGAIMATVALMADAEVSAIEAEIRAMAAFVGWSSTIAPATDNTKP